MQHLIKDNLAVENDPWQIYESENGEAAMPGNALLPVSFWEQNGEELRASSLPFGAFVVENETIDALIPFLDKLAVIAFQFGKFADGRAFSFARELRSQHGFKGEIRAMGDFLPDQVNYMQRCGFNAFAARTENEQATILAVKDAFHVQYQADTRIAEPLFRRR